MTGKSLYKTALFWDGKTFFVDLTAEERSNESFELHDDRDNLYELFVNNSNPADMIKVIDGMEVFYHPSLNPDEVRLLPFALNSKKVLAGLYSQSPTRTQLTKAQDLIDQWGEERSLGNDYCYLSISFPTLMKFSRDLNVACKLLLYSYGKCKEKFLQELLPHPLCLTKDNDNDFAGAYYERFPRYHGSSSTPISFEELLSMSKNDIRSKALHMFNVILSDASPHLDTDKDSASKLKITDYSNNSLVGIWFYFAKMLQRGDVIVCARCGKIHIKERKTRKYCSRSCSVRGEKE